eukprot:9324449-Lingulodinium_polyedra.AAC.1
MSVVDVHAQWTVLCIAFGKNRFTLGPMATYTLADHACCARADTITTAINIIIFTSVLSHLAYRSQAPPVQTLCRLLEQAMACSSGAASSAGDSEGKRGGPRVNKRKACAILGHLSHVQQEEEKKKEMQWLLQQVDENPGLLPMLKACVVTSQPSDKDIKFAPG